MVWSIGSQDEREGAVDDRPIAFPGPVAVYLTPSHTSSAPEFLARFGVDDPAPSHPWPRPGDGDNGLLRLLGYEHVARLCRWGQRVDHARGRVVLRQGEAPASFFLVLSGQVEHRRRLKKGRELILGRTPAGGHFGEASLIDGGPQLASVRCAEPCQLVEFTAERFSRLLADDSRFAMAVAAGLVERVRLVRSKVVALALQEVPERIVACLSEFVRTDSTGRRWVAPMPSHGEIAAHIGSARPSVTRALQQLERAGRIAIKDGAALLLDGAGVKRTT